MKIFKFRLRFHISLFPRAQLTLEHWFRKWLGADQATSHYLNQWWLVYWRIFASLGLIELTILCFSFCYTCIMIHNLACRFLVTLVFMYKLGHHWFRQCFVAFLAPSHHLNQWWFVNHALWTSAKFQLKLSWKKKYIWKISTILLWPQCVVHWNVNVSFWWNFHHWLYWKLSKWQLPEQPVMKISSKWRHLSLFVILR